MPYNKLASFRYRVLDRCFANKYKSFTLTNLIETVSNQLYEHFGTISGVSKRTIQSDISLMRSDPPRGYAAPIVCQDGAYFYSDAQFSIYKSALNYSDIQTLKEISILLMQFKGLPLQQEVVQLIERMDTQKNEINNTKELVSLDTNDLLTGLDFLPIIYNSLRENKLVELCYIPFKSNQALNITVDPYLVKEFNNRWYLIGESDHRKGISTIALDRISSIRKSSKNKSDKKLKLPDFDNLIGVTIPEDSSFIKIKINVANDRLPYLLTKPIHKSQKVLKKYKLYTQISLDLIINQELESLLLSFGSDIIVIEPESLVLQMKTHIKALSNHYKLKTDRKTT